MSLPSNLPDQPGAASGMATTGPRNKSVRLPPLLPQTNNAAELAAILVAVQEAPLTHRVQILSDSKYSLDPVTNNVEKAEDSGFLHTANAPLLRALSPNYPPTSPPDLHNLH
ncbi:hypothetical protein AX14_010832 [Amanita brunnescens Koide BX004]|nr:hypothetical protein AX14_010832 [Amanita brunnescens Koide BX004]